MLIEDLKPGTVFQVHGATFMRITGHACNAVGLHCGILYNMAGECDPVRCEFEELKGQTRGNEDSVPIGTAFKINWAPRIKVEGGDIDLDTGEYDTSAGLEIWLNTHKAILW